MKRDCIFIYKNIYIFKCVSSVIRLGIMEIMVMVVIIIVFCILVRILILAVVLILILVVLHHLRIQKVWCVQIWQKVFFNSNILFKSGISLKPRFVWIKNTVFVKFYQIQISNISVHISRLCKKTSSQQNCPKNSQLISIFDSMKFLSCSSSVKVLVRQMAGKLV